MGNSSRVTQRLALFGRDLSCLVSGEGRVSIVPGGCGVWTEGQPLRDRAETERVKSVEKCKVKVQEDKKGEIYGSLPLLWRYMH